MSRSHHFLRVAVCCCMIVPIAATAADATPPQVIDAARHAGGGGEAFRDPRAANDVCVGAVLETRMADILDASIDLPAGDHAAIFHLLAAPIELMHHLAVTLSAGSTAVTLNQIQFDPSPGYHPYEVRFVHPGGPARFRIQARGGSGFDGMRAAISDQEAAGLPTAPTLDITTETARPTLGAFDEDDLLDLIETERHVRALTAFTHHLLCDRIEIHTLRTAEAIVRNVTVDKIHYRPGETVRAEVTLQAVAGNGTYELLAQDISEIDDAREVYHQSVTLAREPLKIAFTYELDDTEFGRALRCSLIRDGRVIHDHSAFFGVSRNVYRIGITGQCGPQDMRTLTAEQAAALMARNQANYANYFERFAWAPCDFSNLAPATEIFYSGQVQYPGSISGYRNLLNAAHAVGVKGITYGKACAGGIEGFLTFQRHPEFFIHRPEGPATEAVNTFYLERMLANDYLLGKPPSEGGWQHWPSLWTRYIDATVRFGAQAVIDSVALFGWDGIRWDGHFTGNQQPFIDMLNDAYPDFVHGYNTAQARPGNRHFLPEHVEDLHTVANNHGLIMDESVRDWSHTNFSPGHLRPFYEALSREADYIKRIGGLPLFIVFDMASQQDRTFNVLCGLAVGQRYTYITSPGDFLFGPLPRFLTRYSSLIWDDTALIADPDSVLAVTVGGEPAAAAPWWRRSTWLRDRGQGRYQLLVNLLNPPQYPQFCNRIQTPPATLHDVGLTLTLPADAVWRRAVHASPDLSAGHLPLEAIQDGRQVRVTLPRLRTWSVAVFEFDSATQPPFPLTTPVEDSAAILEEQAREKAAKAAEAQAAAETAPAPQPPSYRQYDREFNADAGVAAKLDIPDDLAIRRNGHLDVHHARGVYAWLNPVEAAAGLLQAGEYDASWIDYVGFRRGPRGCMDDFPDTFDALTRFDVLVLDNIHAAHLGDNRRAMIREYVRAGGSLLVFGGYFNLSLGADHNTALADLLPVRIRRYDDVARDPDGLRLQAEQPDFFGDLVDWSRPAACFTLDTSPLKEGTEVLASAGGQPAIVAHRYERGRVVTVLMNPHGNPSGEITPYWEWSQWPRVIMACLRWLGQDAAQVADRTARRAIDPNKPTAEDLFMDAFSLSGADFTKKLKAARENIVDAESARLLLQTAVQEIDKIDDLEVLSNVIERARPYFDAGFSSLGEELLKSHHDFIRQAGYQILGLSGDARFRPVIERALAERSRDGIREGLIALGRLGDPAAIPAVQRHLTSREPETLLAISVLLRLGDTTRLADGLAAFEAGMQRRLRLKSGRRHAHERLYGGVAFKLTHQQRQYALTTYRDVIRLEQQARHDVRHFAESINGLGEPQWETLIEFFRATEVPELLSSAMALLHRLPAGPADAYRARLADANLPGLRLLAAD